MGRGAAWYALACGERVKRGLLTIGRPRLRRTGEPSCNPLAAGEGAHAAAKRKIIQANPRDYYRAGGGGWTGSGGLLLFDERLRLDDGVLVGEGVEGGQEQAARPRLDGDQAQRRQGQAVVRLEVVQQAALAAVRQDL